MQSDVRMIRRDAPPTRKEQIAVALTLALSPRRDGNFKRPHWYTYVEDPVGLRFCALTADASDPTEIDPGELRWHEEQRGERWVTIGLSVSCYGRRLNGYERRIVMAELRDYLAGEGYLLSTSIRRQYYEIAAAAGCHHAIMYTWRGSRSPISPHCRPRRTL